MKYYYDKNYVFIGFTDDETTLVGAIGATEQDPLVTSYYAGPYTFNPINNNWIGLTEDEYNSLPSQPLAPTETDQLKTMVGTLVAENAKKDQAIKQLQTMAGTLIAQVAELQKGSN